MERLGPNPSATINFIQQTLKKEASGGSKRKINRANTKAERLAVLYDGVPDGTMRLLMASLQRYWPAQDRNCKLHN
jgi:hypothetical protein